MAQKQPNHYPGDTQEQITGHPPAGQGTVGAVKASFTRSIGDIVFGMEDGTVSLFGLVFGVASSSATSHAVILAGSTGAVAAAVSMAAGSYLDVTSQNSIARHKIDHEKQELKDQPAKEKQETERWLRQAGFSKQEVQDVAGALARHPGAMLKLHVMQELEGVSQASENAYGHATWMFLADLIAAFTPVMPFFIWSYGTARLISVIVTALLLTAVGIGRGMVAHKNIWATWFETMVVAAAAAAAGVGIGILVNTYL